LVGGGLGVWARLNPLRSAQALRVAGEQEHLSFPMIYHFTHRMVLAHSAPPHFMSKMREAQARRIVTAMGDYPN
jgi:hypothetical protein